MLPIASGYLPFVDINSILCSSVVVSGYGGAAIGSDINVMCGAVD